MRAIIQAVAIVAALAAPTVTFAQSSGLLTRVQVRSGGVSDGSSASSQKAIAELAPSGDTYAPGNNALPVSTTVSAAANATSGYGTPGATSSDSGMGAGSSRSVPPKSMKSSSTSPTVAFGVNNTLATPSTVSPAVHRN